MAAFTKGRQNAPLRASLGELAGRVVTWTRPKCTVCARPIDLRRQAHGWMHNSCEDVPADARPAANDPEGSKP